jgi:hypothetical protein
MTVPDGFNRSSARLGSRSRVNEADENLFGVLRQHHAHRLAEPVLGLRESEDAQGLVVDQRQLAFDRHGQHAVAHAVHQVPVEGAIETTGQTRGASAGRVH